MVTIPSDLKHIYEFGSIRLYLRKRRLPPRTNRSLLTPKAIETLIV